MSDLKVTDRRWWAKEQSDTGDVADEPKLKPSYVEELEQKVAAKDEEIQRLIAQYRSASSEFDDARARLRKELSKDVERGRRSLIVAVVYGIPACGSARFSTTPVNSFIDRLPVYPNRNIPFVADWRSSTNE